VTPPKSSVEPVWLVEDVGRGKTSSRANAPIHFECTQPSTEEPPERVPHLDVKSVKTVASSCA